MSVETGDFYYEIVRHVRTYRGVKIYSVRSIIPGSNIRELKTTGAWADCKPKYDKPVFKYAGGFPHSSIEDCKESIDWIYSHNTIRNKDDERELIEVMNNPDI